VTSRMLDGLKSDTSSEMFHRCSFPHYSPGFVISQTIAQLQP
jgi:hypothetical protein